MGGPSLYNRWWERLTWESGKGLAGPPRASPSACVLGPGGLGPGPRQPHEAPAYCAPELHLSLCHAGPGEGAWPCEGRGRIGAGQERGLGQLQGRVIPDPFAAPPPPAPRPTPEATPSIPIWWKSDGWMKLFNKKKNPSEIVDFRGVLVRVGRLERPVS